MSSTSLRDVLSQDLTHTLLSSAFVLVAFFFFSFMMTKRGSRGILFACWPPSFLQDALFTQCYGDGVHEIRRGPEHVAVKHAEFLYDVAWRPVVYE